MNIRAWSEPVIGNDGHRFELLARTPHSPRTTLLWLPALGVSARHYLPFADALAERGVAVFLHEWRGSGSSRLRPSREADWGYRELLADIAASRATIDAALPGAAPHTLGGHSLGGQLACCHAALTHHAMPCEALWLVASGTPYWRGFAAPRRFGLPLAYRFLPWLARINGTLPGRRIGFGGTEARGVIRDWARVGLSDRYRAEGLDADIESALHRLRLPVRGITLARDWLAPHASLRGLVAHMQPASAMLTRMDAASLGTQADHFAWMRNPSRVAEILTGTSSPAA